GHERRSDCLSQQPDRRARAGTFGRCARSHSASRHRERSRRGDSIGEPARVEVRRPLAVQERRRVAISHMQKLKDWFFALKPRERWMVGAGAVLAVLIVLYSFVLAPFYASVDALAERVERKEGDLAWMRSVAGDVIALSKDAPMMAG